MNAPDRSTSCFSWSVVLMVGLLAAALFMTATVVRVTYPLVDESENDSWGVFGAAVLRGLPPNALLITRGDMYVSPVRYAQSSEGVRPDVRVVDILIMNRDWYVNVTSPLVPDVVFPGDRWYLDDPKSFTLFQFLEANYDRFEIYTFASKRMEQC